MVERSLSACVTIADDEKAREQQDGHSCECEGAELSAERERCWDADYCREKDCGLDNQSRGRVSIGGLFGHNSRSRTSPKESSPQRLDRRQARIQATSAAKSPSTKRTFVLDT